MDADLKLKTALAENEVRRQMEREQKTHERRQQRDPVGQLGAVGHQRHQHCSCQRHQQDQGENRLVDRVHAQCLATFQIKSMEAGQTEFHGTSTNNNNAAAPAASHAA